MSEGKLVQGVVRAKLPSGVTWESLAANSREDIKQAGVWPKGFYPLQFPNHPEGDTLFVKFVIDEI
jgi:hypothetical protein